MFAVTSCEGKYNIDHLDSFRRKHRKYKILKVRQGWH